MLKEQILSTNKYLSLKHGTAIKTFQLLQISNEKITDEDFIK